MGNARFTCRRSVASYVGRLISNHFEIGIYQIQNMRATISVQSHTFELYPIFKRRFTMNEHERPILQILDAYKAAVNKKDVDAFVALYDQDIVVFDMWGEWSYKGGEAWRRMVGDWFGSIGSDRVVVEANDVQVTVESNIASIHAFVTFKGVSADGEELRAMQNRFTWILQNREGEWKILHEHSSAPIDFETSKVILQRQ